MHTQCFFSCLVGFGRLTHAEQSHTKPVFYVMLDVKNVCNSSKFDVQHTGSHSAEKETLPLANDKAFQMLASEGF